MIQEEDTEFVCFVLFARGILNFLGRSLSSMERMGAYQFVLLISVVS